MPDPTQMTFEQGYTRLQSIAERLSGAEVPVSEMVDLFAEGKGLEHALTGYLDTQKARIEQIQTGQELKSFTIVSTPAAATAAA